MCPETETTCEGDADTSHRLPFIFSGPRCKQTCKVGKKLYMLFVYSPATLAGKIIF